VKSSAPGRQRKQKNRETKPPADRVSAPAERNYLRHLLAVAALSALTILAFSNSFQSGFVLDNKGLLLDPRIHDATPQNIALIFRHTYWWPTGEAGLYRPFTTLSYLFNYAILGDRDQPGGYHLINLILHLANVLLAYALALRLIRRFWPAVFVAALWAVHPVLTESVTNIVGRADLLAAIAVLSGLLMYLKSAEARTWLARVAWLAGLAAVTSIGVFSKESAIAILPLIALYELTWWKERPDHRALALGLAATLLPIGVMLYQRSAVLAASAPAEFPFTDNPLVGADWLTARLTAIKVMARYLWLVLWPANLSCDYSYNQIALAHGAPADWLAYFVILAVAIGVVLLYRWNRVGFFLACFAFVNFLPASNLFFSIGTIMAERLLYLPALGLIACLVLAIYSLRTPAIAPVIFLSLITAGFAIRTWIRNQDWQTEYSLASSDVRVSPNSFKLHRLLAGALFDSDHTHANIDHVIEEQDKSLAILDTIPLAQNGPEPYRRAGYYYLVKGDQTHELAPAQSKPAYEKALQDLLRSNSIAEARASRSPADPETYLLLSLTYVRLENPYKALEAVNKARALDPLNPQIYRQLARVFDLQGRKDEGDVASMLDHAITSLQEAKWQDAADLTGRVIQIHPAEYPSAYFFNAMANLRLGRLDVAEKSAREAIRLDADHRNPQTSYVLGMILAQKHDYRQAATLLNAYLTAVPNAADAETVRKQLGEIEKLAR
jgi:tetratricopeptide (TPR) repeat protein